LIHTPVWHSFAINQALRGWRYGHSVVFPSKQFNVEATLRALQNEKCTYMAAVPPLVRALVANPAFSQNDPLSLLYVSMGGTLITYEDVQFCKEKLGSESVIQAFGMTEGIPIASWLRDDPLLKDGYHSGIGKSLPGAAMRICSPGSRQPLRRNESGELHISGTSVIAGYLGGIEAGAFYEDNNETWFITGDQARIDPDGVLYIIGRYKDIIIRGGENLVPAKIEQCLAQFCGVAVSITIRFYIFNLNFTS